ncbi:Inositol oxygenase [Arcticibacter svalbardensis MN12-7]|uniref:Inositol oxygenase n=1 Tax=Arcticibacter svalbardensis MN12-7 TaxID=1150600 RepID=R9GLJ8_9SPHI|nr:inositol oxygenase family protein [Arcticibacter svalbardensis]EOR92588.1 Inositol oxygenase [Arcticibacter svalbardensis MN12-7]
MKERDSNLKKEEKNPLKNLDEWEENILKRYPSSDITNKPKETFRNYNDAQVKENVKEFYRLNHKHQTYDFVTQKREDYLKFDKKEMPIWQAFDFLNQLVDDSDPDTDMDQLQHLLQTSEAIRKDNHPDWMILTGLMHDMGKVLCLFGEPQWAVVGDTFPVGCAYSKKIVYSDFFKDNSDYNNPKFNSKYGVYDKGCGLRNINMSWGHDEYIYQMLKNHLPEEGLYMLRYHSFYAWHREGEYNYFLDDHDRKMLPWVHLFNPYDLYSKSPTPPMVEELKPYYEALIKKYLPETLKF